MRLTVERKGTKVYPDSKRVIARYFFNGNERARHVIQSVVSMDDAKVFSIISPLLQEYSKRHRNITKVLYRHCKRLKHLFSEMDIDEEQLSSFRKLLIGSYQFAYWQHTQLTLDVTEGRGASFSLEIPYGVRFVIQSRIYTEEETAHLSPIQYGDQL